MSKDCASEKLTPRRTRAAPSRRLAPSRKFSVPRTSSAPHRPQLEQRSAAAAMAPSGSVRSRAGISVTLPTAGDGVSPGKMRCLMGGINGVDTAWVNLAGLDLNLLVSLDALLQERSVTKAAARMGLSQPALSASLARLRRHFGDELLSRVGNEYRLTPLAVQLRELSRAALTGIERVFDAQPAFDPASSAREFHLLVSDYIVAVLGDTIAELLAEEAPNARLRLSANTPAAVDRAEQILLSTDLLVLPHGFVTDLSHRDLYRDEWVCVVSADHPAVQDGLTVEDLETLPWVVTYHGPTAATPASRQMRMRGIEPHVQVITESFLTLRGVGGGSARVALLQRKLVALLPLNVGVRALPCPVEVGQLVEAMWGHPVFDDDPEHAYLRDLVRRAAELAVGPGLGADIDLVDTGVSKK